MPKLPILGGKDLIQLSKLKKKTCYFFAWSLCVSNWQSDIHDKVLLDTWYDFAHFDITRLFLIFANCIFSLHHLLSSLPNCCMSCLVKQVCERPLHSLLLHQLHQFVDHSHYVTILCHFSEGFVPDWGGFVSIDMLILCRYCVNVLLCLTECQFCVTFVIVTTCHSKAKQECHQTNVFSFKRKHIWHICFFQHHHCWPHHHYHQGHSCKIGNTPN